MLFRSDRKSTRLNSSHLVISYAVFCLKKKKNDAHTPERAAPRTVTCRPRCAAETARPASAHAPAVGPPPPEPLRVRALFFFFNDTATTEIYTLSLHDALPI